jgi:hypothetical protein
MDCVGACNWDYVFIVCVIKNKIVTVRVSQVVYVSDGDTRNKRIMILSNVETRPSKLVSGLISYISKYLISVDYEIHQRYDGNDVVIEVRIKNLAEMINKYG